MKQLILIASILLFQFTQGQLDPNGVLILNSGTTAEINAISPDAGALVYNTDTKKTYVYDGATWVIATGTNENWTKSGNNQYSAVSGNVGIGTNSPSTKLDVNGRISSRADGGLDYVASGIHLYSHDDYRGAGIFSFGQTKDWFFGNPYTDHDGKFVIAVANQTGDESVAQISNTKFTVQSNGNVGIGTTNPSVKLDVKGSLRVNTNSNYSSINLGQEINDRLFADNSADDYYGGGLWLRVHDNAAPNQYRDVMMLSKSGNVGIGVLKPTTKLEVAGQVKITGGSPGSGKILTSDASGLATWQNPSNTVDGILTEGDTQTMFGSAPGSSTGNCVVSHGIATFFTSTGDNNYIHIKLPYRIDTHNRMYHIRATGYRYGAAKTIDITWTGYCYKNGSNLLSTNHINSGSPEFQITQYIGSDNHIYLRFKGTTGSNYYQSFRIDSMKVGNGSVLAEGDIQIISSASANL